MADIKGILTPFGQVGTVLDIEKEVQMSSNWETPMFSFLNRGSAKDVAHVWDEDKVKAMTLTTTSHPTATSLTITVADGSIVPAGVLILVESEVMRVTNVSTNTLTVTRGWGSTAASHVSSISAKIMSPALVVGADAPSAACTLKVRKSNQVQTIVDTILVAGQSRRIYNTGGDPYTYNTKKVGDEQAIRIEMSIYYGTYYKGTASLPGTFQGARSRISTLNTNRGTTITKAVLNTLVSTCRSNGGRPKTLLCGYTFQDALQFLSETKLQTVIEDKTFGVNIMGIQTAHGMLKIIPTPWLLTGSAFMLTDDLMSWCPTDGGQTQLIPLAKTGDADKAMILTEGTLKLACEWAHGYVSGVTGGA